jgi:colanic acid/amylovoran biosynthesis protein
MNYSPTILIYNVHSAMNAGDRALLECTIRQMRTNFPQAHFIILANWPEEPYFKEGDWEVIPSAWICSGIIHNWPIWKQIIAAGWGWLAAFMEARLKLHIARGNWQRLFDAYRRADLVVGVAGNQHYSTGRFGWPFPVTAMAPALGCLFDKPVYTMPQSWGPLKRGWERYLMRMVYGGSRLILVRDAVSLQLTRELKLPPEKVAYLPDIAFDFPAAAREEALTILGRYGYIPGTPAVGATILADPGRAAPAGKMSIYYDAMAEVLRRLGQQYDLPVYLFIQVGGPTVQENDRLVSRQFLDRMGADGHHIRLVDEFLSPAQLKACYGCMDLFLPTRLHSGIFALTMNVPCVFVGYLTKTLGVLQSLGLEDWLVQVGSIETEELWQKIEAAWLERKERSARLAALLPAVITESGRAGTLIAEDFARYGR